MTCSGESLTRAQLDDAAGRLAHHLRGLGVVEGSMVTIALANSVAWVASVMAVWKLGAIPQPVSWRLPGPELQAIVDLADPVVILGAGDDLPGARRRPHLDAAAVAGVMAAVNGDPGPLPDAVSPAWKAPTSGGSTGRPKLIVSGDPSLLDPDAAPRFHIEPDGCMVMPGPLYHNGPVVWACQALLAGNHLVVLPRFDAAATLAAIDEHRADIVYLVPTMMKRIWRLPPEERERHDLSSLRVVWHLAEPCPPWLKQAWIDWLGAGRIWELYAGTEAQASTVISGDEWVAHRGSVGRPVLGDVTVTDDEGVAVGAGVEGEVWMRNDRATPTYRYLGATPRSREGGWESLGDRGWLDEEGYLYLGDRSADMILCGGANIYPAEIEAALSEHPAVASCAVVGLPDADLGNRIHAIVEPVGDPPDPADLTAWLAGRLVTYKLPRSWEVVDTPLRDDAGKVRRSALRAERLGSKPEEAPPVSPPPVGGDRNPGAVFDEDGPR